MLIRDLVEEAKWCVKAKTQSSRIKRLRRLNWKKIKCNSAIFKKVYIKDKVVVKLGDCAYDILLYKNIKKARKLNFLARLYDINKNYMIQRAVTPLDNPSVSDKDYDFAKEQLSDLFEELKDIHNIDLSDTGDRNIGVLNGKLKIFDGFAIDMKNYHRW
jgi:hypothetical protein